MTTAASAFGVDSSGHRSDFFKPGRTIYEFNLDPRDHSNVPTTVMRSLEDIPTFEVCTAFLFVGVIAAQANENVKVSFTKGLTKVPACRVT